MKYLIPIINIFIPSICIATDVEIRSISVVKSIIEVKCNNKTIRLIVKNEEIVTKQDYIINFFESQCKNEENKK